MADSIRKQILDATEGALKTIDGIRATGQNLTSWEELKTEDFPAAFAVDGNASYERLTFKQSTETDMRCELEMQVFGYVKDSRGQDNLSDKRTQLIKDIEVALTSNTTLAGLTRDVTPATLLTDVGTVDNFSIIRYTFRVEYDYNHATP